MRLDKYLSLQGYGTKEKTKQLIKEGKVSYQGEIIYSPSFFVENESLVDVDSSVKKYIEYTYVMMNKPQDYICATKDDEYKTVIDLLDENLKNRNLFPVGRLDIDTVGLLLLTNDSHFAKKMTLPEYNVEKKYLVTFGGDITKIDVNSFEKGVILPNGYITKPSKIELLSSDQLLITISEGKYHEIKKMFDSLGLKVVRLKRIQMGDYILDESLKEGEYKIIKKR